MVPKQAGPKKNVMVTICSKNLGGKFEKKDWTVNGKLTFYESAACTA